MTPQEEKEVIRVCGPNYEESDIPAYIRRRDFEDEMRQVEIEDREAEEVGSEEYPLGGMVEPYDIEREKN